MKNQGKEPRMIIHTQSEGANDTEWAVLLIGYNHEKKKRTIVLGTYNIQYLKAFRQSLTLAR